MDKRRVALEAWMKENGRTPMKRLSYVQPCWTVAASTTKVCRTEVNKARQRDAHAPLKNNNRTEVKKASLRHAYASLKKNKSCLRDSTVPQHVREDTAMTAEERLAMREAFQKDIDNTVAEILAEEAIKSVAKELKFEEDPPKIEARMDKPTSPSLTTPTSIPSHIKEIRKRRSSAYFVNAELAFQSSKIRYSLVDKGRKRWCDRSFPFKQQETEGTVEKHYFYLTPVRRSMRRSCSVCPHAAARGEPCFDSPTELQQRKGYEGVEVLPNKSLDVMMANYQ